MTRDVIPGSRGQSYQRHQQLVAKPGQGYEIPSLIDATTSILMAYYRKNERLYGQEPWTYTYCQEKDETSGLQTACGGFGAFGPHIYFYNDHETRGVAAAWRF